MFADLIMNRGHLHKQCPLFNEMCTNPEQAPTVVEFPRHIFARRRAIYSSRTGRRHWCPDTSHGTKCSFLKIDVEKLFLVVRRRSVSSEPSSSHHNAFPPASLSTSSTSSTSSTVQPPASLDPSTLSTVQSLVSPGRWFLQQLSRPPAQFHQLELCRSISSPQIGPTRGRIYSSMLSHNVKLDTRA
jgi:hypothetical protein